MIRRLNLLPLSVLLMLSGCTWFGFCPEKSKQGSQMHVINVLDKALYDDAHITGSEQVDFAQVKDAASQWNKDDTIVFYCSNYQCQASKEAARQLQELGFAHAMAYEGGMEEWNRLSKGDANQNISADPSYAVTGAAAQDYLNVRVPRPAIESTTIKIVSAQELKQMMQQAGLLA